MEGIIYIGSPIIANCTLQAIRFPIVVHSQTSLSELHEQTAYAATSDMVLEQALDMLRAMHVADSIYLVPVASCGQTVLTMDVAV